MCRWIVLGFTAVFALLAPALPAEIPNPESLKGQALIVQELSAKEKKILAQLEALAQKINQKREEIEALSEEIARRELILRQLNQKISLKEKELTGLEARFQERLKRLATTGKVGWLNLILSPQEVASFFRRQEYVYLILYHDQQLAKNLKEEKEELLKQKQLVLAEKERLKGLKEQYQQQLVVLEKLKKEKEALLEEVRRNKKLYAETLRMLENAYAAISKMAEELKRTREELEITRKEIEKAKRRDKKIPPLLEVKGLIPPPFEGEVIRFFGLNKDPLSGKHFYQAGITILAPAGSPVRAPYAGKIVKISYLREKGFLVFIDHGYHFLSVIGGLGKVSKGPGEEVSTGDIIGEVGESPYEESGVYYELRYQGRPQNPLDWLDTSKLKLLR